MNKLKNPVLLAQIGAPHGIKGQVRVTSFTEIPEDFGSYGPLFDEYGTRFTLQNCRPSKNVLISTFKEINSRDQAENLRGTELFVDREKLPEPDEEDEFYISDLIGLDVYNRQEELVGTIKNSTNFGAGDLIEIKSAKGKMPKGTWFLEFTRINVPEIDFDQGRILINPPNEISERDDEADQEAS